MSEEKEIKSTDGLYEFLKEKWPMGVVYISTISTFFVFFKTFYGNPPDGSTVILYFTLALISSLLFIGLLALLYYREEKISSKHTCQILEEKDEYDLQEQESGKINVTCRQHIKIKVLYDKIEKFQTFFPLYEGNPVKFLCKEGPNGKPFFIDLSNVRAEPNGVRLPLSRNLLKSEKVALPIIEWTYEKLPDDHVIRTSIIARPTSKLNILVSLPPNKPRPKDYDLRIINIEGEDISRPKRTKCFQVGDRYCLSVKIRAKEGLRYGIFWKYSAPEVVK